VTAAAGTSAMTSAPRRHGVLLLTLVCWCRVASSMKLMIGRLS